MNRHPGREEPGDQVWYGPDGERVYRAADDVPVTTWLPQWVNFIGGDVAPEAPEPVQEPPGHPLAAQVAIAATPTPIPLSRAGRIRAAMAAVRKGDRAAVDVLRELLMGE